MKRLVAVGLLVVGLFGCASKPVVREAQVDPKVNELLDAMTATLTNAKSFSFNVVSTAIPVGGNDDQAVVSKYAMALERPGKLAIRQLEGKRGVTFIADGKLVTTHPTGTTKYMQAEQTHENVSDLLASDDARGLGFGSMTMSFCRAFFMKDPKADMMAGVNVAKYVGQANLDGVAAHHLQFEQAQMNWELFIAPGEHPFPLRLSVELKGRGSRPGTKITIVLSAWNLNPSLPDKTFAFEAPEGAEKVESLFKKEEKTEAAAETLLGKAAPELKLKLLDGGTFDLASHRGRDIVILDFWATWCGPCKMALPVLADLAESYKSKGVVLYAVNQDETPGVIQGFLKENKKLKVTVALDPEGKAGARFGVDGIPHMVIVGKDGRVQVIHVGYSSNLKSEIKENLNALLAGKDLAAQQKSGHP